MPTSEKRVAANRINATKSTGPRTPEGKANSRLNALTHGLTAQTAVLPGEDREALELLAASLMKQLDPRGVVQRLIAERIVALAWKLRRAARAEEAVGLEMRKRPGHDRLGRHLGRADGARMLAESIRYSGEHYIGEWYDTRLSRLTDYELKLDAALRAGVRELMRLQKEARAFREVEDEREGERAAPEAGAPSAAGDAPRLQNEPNAADAGAGGDDGNEGDDPGPRCAAPATRATGPGEARGEAPGDARAEAPLVETNPPPMNGDSPHVGAAPGVTPGSVTGSSAPVPGTSSSPPPGPRR